MGPLVAQRSFRYAPHQTPTCFAWGKVGRLWASRPSAAGTGLLAILSPTPPTRNSRSPSSQSRRYNTWFKDVAICCTEELLATVDNRGNVMVFHIAANRYTRLGQAGPSGTCVRFSTTSRALLVSGHCDGGIRCFNANTGAELGTLRGHRTAVRWLDFKPGSGELASTSHDCVIVWHMRNMTRKRTLGADSSKGGGFCAGKYLQEGSKLVTSCKDGSFLVWDSKSFTLLGRVSSGECSRAVRDCGQVPMFCVSPDGKWLVFSKDHPSLLVCDLASCTLCYGLRLDGEGGMGARALEFMPNSEVVAVLGKDGCVRFLEVKTGRVCYKVLDQENGKEGEKFSISARAQLLAVTGEPGRVYLYDMSKVRARGPPVPEETVESAVFMNSNDVNDFLAQPVLVADSSDNVTSTVKQDNCVRGTSQNREVARNNAVEGTSKSGLHQTRTKEINPSQLRIAALGPEGNSLNRNKLQGLLHSYGEYPEKYRLLIWEFLLEIPQNSCAFEVIANKEMHPAFKHLKEKFPSLDKATLKRLGKTLSSLAHWCPLFGEATFLPPLIFPIVKQFGHNEETCFETVATVLFNWAGTWFQEFPRPPMSILAKLEGILTHHEPQISSALSSFKGGSGKVFWAIMSTLMSEVVSRQDWLKLWDHIVTNDITFLHFCLVSHLIYFKQSLMAFEKEEDVEAFAHIAKPLDINKIILQTYTLQSTTPEHLKPIAQDFKGLGNRNVYPDFTQYPQGEVGWMSEERARIQSEEDALLRRRWILEELESKTVKLEAQLDHSWMNIVQAKQLAEQESQKQRDALRAQEQDILAEKARLDDQLKQERIKQIAIMEDTYRLGLENMQSEMNQQVSKEKEEIAQKKEALLQDLRSAKEEQKINVLEFQSQQRLLSLQNKTLQHEAQKRLQCEARTRLAAADASQKNKLEAWRAEDLEGDARRRLQAVARSDLIAVANENAARLDVEESVRKAEIEQEAQLLKIENERLAHLRACEEVERAQRMVEEERKRGEILAIQDQAILRAQAEEDLAWFEKEKVLKDELIAEQKALRHKEDLARKREHLDKERHSKLHQAEIDLLVRRREMERALLLKEQEAQRYLMELERERNREKIADTEMLHRQKELEERVQHATKVSKLQEEVEAYERAKILKDNMGANEAMCRHEADAQQRHQEIMSKLALERERQLLELDTAWRKQVRIEETAKLKEDRSKLSEEEQQMRSEHLAKERGAAKEVADIRRKAKLAKFQLDPKERLLTSQLLSDDDTVCGLSNSKGPPLVEDKKIPLKAKPQARGRNLLFSSGASSNLDELLPELPGEYKIMNNDKAEEVSDAQSIGEAPPAIKDRVAQKQRAEEHPIYSLNEIAQKNTSHKPPSHEIQESTFKTHNITAAVDLPGVQAARDKLRAYERRSIESPMMDYRDDLYVNDDEFKAPKEISQRPETSHEITEKGNSTKLAADDSLGQNQSATLPILHGISPESITRGTSFVSKECIEEENQVSTVEINPGIISRCSFIQSEHSQPLSVVPEESSTRSSVSAVQNDPGLNYLQATRSRISALLDEVLGADGSTNGQQDESRTESTEYARSKDFNQMMQELKLDEPSSASSQSNSDACAEREDTEAPAQEETHRYFPSYRSQFSSPVQHGTSSNSSFELGQSQEFAGSQISPSKKATWMHQEEDSQRSSPDQRPIGSPVQCAWESDTVIESLSCTKSNDLHWNVNEYNQDATGFPSYSSSQDETAKGIQDCQNNTSSKLVKTDSNTSSIDLNLHALTGKSSESEFNMKHSALKNAMDSLQHACTQIQIDRHAQDRYF